MKITYHFCALFVASVLGLLNPVVAISAESSDAPCTVLADARLGNPLQAIVTEFQHRTGTTVKLSLMPADKVEKQVTSKRTGADVVLLMAEKPKQDADYVSPAVEKLPGAKTVAWKYPTAEPVWAAVVGDHSSAKQFIEFAGGPTGHLLWSRSPDGFTIVTGPNHAEAFKWVVENRVGHTYKMTAARMIRECGGMNRGLCIDIGCGTGNLDVELASQTELMIIGLDIDGDMKPIFDKHVAEKGYSDRIRFVEGDAQDLPFPDDSADYIVSRGTLTFIPDIGKCLREVDRVLKPSGVAFLGGRYLYTPQPDKISNEKLAKIVADCGVKNAELITGRGQWVKIVGSEASPAAKQVATGPHLLSHRFIADTRITEGRALILCRSDGILEQGLMQGFLDNTEMKLTALYPNEEVAAEARKRITDEKLTDRITCAVGSVYAIPAAPETYDGVLGVGPILLWGEREKGMKEIHRVLKKGGAALVGGKFLGMPEWRKTPSDVLRASAKKTGLPGISVSDDMGQWVVIRKGVGPDGR